MRNFLFAFSAFALTGPLIAASASAPSPESKESHLKVLSGEELEKAYVIDKKAARELNALLANRLASFLACPKKSRKSRLDQHWENVSNMKWAVREWAETIAANNIRVDHRGIGVEEDIVAILVSKYKMSQADADNIGKWLKLGGLSGKGDFNGLLARASIDLGNGAFEEDKAKPFLLGSTLASKTDFVNDWNDKWKKYVDQADRFVSEPSKVCADKIERTAAKWSREKAHVNLEPAKVVEARKAQEQAIAKAAADKEAAEIARVRKQKEAGTKGLPPPPPPPRPGATPGDSLSHIAAGPSGSVPSSREAAPSVDRSKLDGRIIELEKELGIARDQPVEARKVEIAKLDAKAADHYLKHLLAQRIVAFESLSAAAIGKRIEELKSTLSAVQLEEKLATLNPAEAKPASLASAPPAAPKAPAAKVEPETGQLAQSLMGKPVPRAIKSATLPRPSASYASEADRLQARAAFVEAKMAEHHDGEEDLIDGVADAVVASSAQRGIYERDFDALNPVITERKAIVAAAPQVKVSADPALAQPKVVARILELERDLELPAITDDGHQEKIEALPRLEAQQMLKKLLAQKVLLAEESTLKRPLDRSQRIAKLEGTPQNARLEERLESLGIMKRLAEHQSVGVKDAGEASRLYQTAIARLENLSVEKLRDAEESEKKALRERIAIVRSEHKSVLPAGAMTSDIKDLSLPELQTKYEQLVKLSEAGQDDADEDPLAVALQRTKAKQAPASNTAVHPLAPAKVTFAKLTSPDLDVSAALAKGQGPSEQIPAAATDLAAITDARIPIPKSLMPVPKAPEFPYLGRLPQVAAFRAPETLPGLSTLSGRGAPSTPSYDQLVRAPANPYYQRPFRAPRAKTFLETNDEYRKALAIEEELEKMHSNYQQILSVAREIQSRPKNAPAPSDDENRIIAEAQKIERLYNLLNRAATPEEVKALALFPVPIEVTEPPK